MTDALRPHEYRVTFLNLVNGVKYEATVHASREFLAWEAGHQMLTEHLAKTAGQRHDWTHYYTVRSL